ncbi:MAG: hypothetical protein EA392_11220 [Cryomorphaceae bacterium]|nr:MAG: hypothetical protein EA392_11220 [Cryomorphaceae bacterium]
MIVKYYEDSDLRNDGERRFAQLIDQVFRYDPDHHWYVLHGLNLSNHISQKEGECDFVLICEKGIVVIECKGGHISRREGRFYRKNINYHTRESTGTESNFDDPFTQASHNAGTIVKTLQKRKVKDTFVGYMVFFAHCSFNYEGTEWKPDVHFMDGLTDSDAHGRILKALDSQKTKASEEAGNPDWKAMKPLSVEAIKNIANIFSPNVTPDTIRDNINFGIEETRRLADMQRAIFGGLSENNRLMIQGPPGSGKSRAARHYMSDQHRQGKRGLYVCWNIFLAAEMEAWVNNAGLNVEVKRYYDWIKKELLVQSGIPADELTYTNQSSKIPELLAKVVNRFSEKQDGIAYDYIVVDEAQDIFHLGIDIVLDHFVGEWGDGLQTGSYWLLYDTLQGYNPTDFDTIELLKMFAAHFRLKNRFRASGTPGILKLVTDIDTGSFSRNGQYGNSVIMKEMTAPKEVLKDIARVFTEQQRLKNYSPENSIVLFSSNLFDPTGRKKDRVFNELLSDKKPFETLTDQNLTDPKGLQCTTILRFKGLERDVVFLVLRNPEQGEASKEMYQFFIGASRAKAQLHIYLISQQEL